VLFESASTFVALVRYMEGPVRQNATEKGRARSLDATRNRLNPGPNVVCIVPIADPFQRRIEESLQLFRSGTSAGVRAKPSVCSENPAQGSSLMRVLYPQLKREA